MLKSLTSKNLFSFGKIYSSALEAINGVKDGSFLLVGGFGICGTPMNLINALRQSGAKNLTVASNNCGVNFKENLSPKQWGLSVLLHSKQIKKMISSYVGENIQFQRQYFNGELELEICPQGTLAEKIRSGGAGIPAFYTATGVDTIVQKGGFPIKFKNQNGKVVRDITGNSVPQIISQRRNSEVFDGKKYILQKSITGDFSFIKAKKADRLGNLVFEQSQRNFNADMATAGKCVIAQVEQIVDEPLNPQHIHVPAIYVDRIFKSDPENQFSHKYYEKLTISDQSQIKKMVKQKDLQAGKVKFVDNSSQNVDTKAQMRLKIARRAAKEVKNGMNVNLGIGIPTLLPSVLPQDVKIYLQSENGIMGVGFYPSSKTAKASLINAGKQTVTLSPYGSYFSSSQSFAIIRGNHLDVTMLGSLQVSQNGDIANWYIPGKMMKGMGGAMDLVASGSKVIVLMEHFNKSKKGDISIKLLDLCNLPLTAKGVVSMVITQLAVFENKGGKLILTEVAEGQTIESVQKVTGFKIQCADKVGTF